MEDPDVQMTSSEEFVHVQQGSGDACAMETDSVLKSHPTNNDSNQKKNSLASAATSSRPSSSTSTKSTASSTSSSNTSLNSLNGKQSTTKNVTKSSTVAKNEKQQTVTPPAKSCSASKEIDGPSDEEKAKAEEFKNQGNILFKSGKYRDSIELYSKAIKLCPKSATYYGNRAAAQLTLNCYKEAIQDSQTSTKLDENFTKGYVREGKAQLAQGDFLSALRCFQKAKQLEPTNKQIDLDLQNANAVKHFYELAHSAFNSGDYRRVVFLMDKSMHHSTNCVSFKLFKAECLALLGRYQEAQEIANDVVMRDQKNSDALYVRGMCLYYQNQHEKANQHFQRVLQYSPDHTKAHTFYKKAKLLLQKKEQGNQAFKSGKWEEAYKLYTESLQIDPLNKALNATLYCNRATTAAKLNKLDQSILDCTKAIELDEGYIKAYLRRAKSYKEKEEYEQAVFDYEKVYKLDKTKENQQMLRDAKHELKLSKRKDYYKILGCSKGATEDEIKKAYRKSALKHHPDRFPNATEEEKAEEEKKFKEVGEAYAVLSDSKKRARFDNGQDLDDMSSGMGGADIDPNVLFQAFFSGGASPFSFGGGGGGRSSRNGGGGGSFPGGFQFSFG